MTNSRRILYRKLSRRLTGDRRRQARERADTTQTALASAYRKRAWRHVLAGDLAGARADLRRSFHTAPLAWRSAAALAATPSALLLKLAARHGLDQPLRRNDGPARAGGVAAATVGVDPIAAAPAVSVVVPLYQTEAYIAATLDSVLAQTFADFEVIVIDDGSTDRGPEIARAYAARDPRIHYLHQDNAGLGAARNTAIAAARGTYLAFLDSDDLWQPDKLERQLAVATPDTLVYTDVYLLRGDHKTTDRFGDVMRFQEGDVFAPLLEDNFVPVLTVLVGRALVVEHGSFDPALQRCEDYDLWLRLAAAGVRFTFVDEPLGYYRLRPDSLSSDSHSMASSRLLIYRKQAAELTGVRRQHARERAHAIQVELASAFRKRAWRHVLAGELPSARADLRRSFHTAPLAWRSIVALTTTPSARLLRLAARHGLDQPLRPAKGR